MKKFAGRFLLTPYMKYGNSFLFNSLVPITCLSSVIIGEYYPSSFIFNLSIAFALIVFAIIILITLAGSIKYDWSELNSTQKLIKGERKDKLNFHETCEWVKLYGSKVTKNEINSKL